MCVQFQWQMITLHALFTINVYQLLIIGLVMELLFLLTGL